MCACVCVCVCVCSNRSSSIMVLTDLSHQLLHWGKDKKINDILACRVMDFHESLSVVYDTGYSVKRGNRARTFRRYTSACSIILWIMHARPFCVKLRCFRCSLFKRIFERKINLTVKTVFLQVLQIFLEQNWSFRNSAKKESCYASRDKKFFLRVGGFRPCVFTFP